MDLAKRQWSVLLEIEKNNRKQMLNDKSHMNYELHEDQKSFIAVIVMEQQVWQKFCFSHSVLSTQV